MEDCQGCLVQQRIYLDPLDRQLAETTFKLSLAHLYAKDLEKAKEGVLESIQLLESRLAKISSADANDKGKGKERQDSTETLQNEEAKELSDLIELMREKLEDINFLIQNPEEMTAPANVVSGDVASLTAAAAVVTTTNAFTPAANSASVNVLTSLVRKRETTTPNASSSSAQASSSSTPSSSAKPPPSSSSSSSSPSSSSSSEPVTKKQKTEE